MKDPLRRVVLLLASGALIAAAQSSTTVKAATTYTTAYANPADPLAAAGPAYFYEENFDGTSLDSSHWTASTNGGLTVSVDNGSLHMGQGGSSSLDFPYVSSVGTVFPTGGNFQVEIAAQYSQHGGQGDGIAVLGPDHQPLFILWGSGLVVALEGTPQVAVAGPFDLHNYRLTFVDGVASVYVDNVHVLTAPLSVRPESLWLGTPTIGQVSMWPLWSGWVGIVDGHVDPTTAVVLSRWWWGTNWSPFSVDYIRVSTVTQPAWRFPWSFGTQWHYTGGPHGWGTSTLSGLDFDMGPSSHVDSISDGTVYFIGQENCIIPPSTPAPCNTVKIRDDTTGWETWYVHLASFAPGLQVGSAIRQGFWIGEEGSSGASSRHLHLELRYKGAPYSWDGQVMDGWTVHVKCGANAPQGCTDGELNGYIENGSKKVIPMSPAGDSQFVGPSTSPSACAIFRTSATVTQGATIDRATGVSPGQPRIYFLISWFGSTVDTSLTAPDGTSIGPDTTDPDVFHNKGDTFEYYEIQNPLSGTWTADLYGSDIPVEGENVDILVAGQSPSAVGGIAEYALDPDGRGPARGSPSPVTAILAGLAVCLLLLAASGWYARRRRLI
jgi:murein DD-endopeptidase MepM/ murein hydrolase activator NlpD